MKRPRELDILEFEPFEEPEHKKPRMEVEEPVYSVSARRSGPRLASGHYYSPKARRQYKKKVAKKKYVRRRSTGSRGRYGSISVIQGRGDYTMDPNASFGTRYGGYLGSKAGEFLGGMAQRAFSSITGLGDYNVSKNVFLGGNLPQIMNESGGGGTVIRFQEYLGDITTSNVANTFKIQRYNLNAADSICFPFLSQIAANYEQYEFEGVIFQFRSTSADALNSTNTALGSVMMATQYDFLDTEFQAKSDMLNYEFSSSCKPSENCLHMIECAPRMTTINNLYTLSGALPANADPRLYHLGKFSIATTGFQGTNVNIGELHVTYQVRLLKPKLNVSLGGVVDNYVRTLGGVNCYTSAVPLGPSISTQTTYLRDLMGVTQTGTSITFLPSNAKLSYYILVVWYGDGGGGTNVTYPVVTPTNCTINTSDTAPFAGVGIVTAAMLGIQITTSGNGLAPSLTFGAAGVLPGCAGGGSMSLLITQLNPGIF